MPAALPSLLAALCWGAMFPIADRALRHVDAANITAIRYGIASLAFLGLLRLVEGAPAVRYDGRFLRLFLLGTAGFAGFNLLTFAGLPHTTPEHAALFVATTPLLTLLARWGMYGQRPGRAQLAAVGVALVGVALVISKGHPSALVHGGISAGDLLVLAGVACWVRYTLGAAELPGWSPLRYTALSAAAGTLTIVALTVAGDATGVLATPSAGDVGDIAPALGYIVVFGAVVAVLSWNAGVRRLGPADASLFMNLVPITAFVIVALQGTAPGAAELAGAALTLAAVVTANLAGRPQLAAGRRLAAQQA